MNADDPIVLYIIFKRSMNLDSIKLANYAANAVEYILLKYFTLQVLAVKSNNEKLTNHNHIKLTTAWLSTQSQKCIVSVDDFVWDNLKNDFCSKKDAFCLKNTDIGNAETTIVFWPDRYSSIACHINKI